MVEEQKENCAIERLNRKPLIELNLWEPLIIHNSSLPRKRESSYIKNFWIPASAGMTFLEVALFIQLIFYRKVTLYSIETLYNVLVMVAERLRPSD